MYFPFGRGKVDKMEVEKTFLSPNLYCAEFLQLVFYTSERILGFSVPILYTFFSCFYISSSTNFSQDV